MVFRLYNTLYNNNGIGENVTLFDKFTSYDLWCKKTPITLLFEL